ncbi:MAG: hypothetical protein ACI4V1_03290 [Eubacteriales bacterium]
MLYVLQYLSLLAALSLPFSVGGIVRFTKSGERKKRALCCALLAAAAVILAVTLGIAFRLT